MCETACLQFSYAYALTSSQYCTILYILLCTVLYCTVEVTYSTRTCTFMYCIYSIESYTYFNRTHQTREIFKAFLYTTVQYAVCTRILLYCMYPEDL